MSNERMEDMLGQLIQMVGSIRKEINEKFEEVDAKVNQIMIYQQEMKDDINLIKDHLTDTAETVTILTQKVGLHDVAIEKIKRKLID